MDGSENSSPSPQTQEMDDLLMKFVKESTAKFDESHNWEHAEIVTKRTHEVMRSFDRDYEYDVVNFAAMLHDVCDHKYPDSIPRDELEGFIKMHMPADYTRIIEIIDNVSYSRQVKGLRKTLEEPDNTYLTALSDADRLEAIGSRGVERCKAFTRAHGGDLEEVVQHCHDKLLRLLPEGFIVSEYARKLAAPLHQEIIDFVEIPS